MFVLNLHAQGFSWPARRDGGAGRLPGRGGRPRTQCQWRGVQPGGGGGGGTQMLFGRGCEAEASKPVPIFKGNFGGKGYPLLGVWRKRVPIIRDFLVKKIMFLCTLATKLRAKLQKWGACLGIFQLKTGTHV